MTVFHVVIVPPSPALAGKRITSRQGAITANVAQTRALTGQVITSTKGTVAFSKSGLQLVGQQITSRQGAVTATAASTLTVGLTGLRNTFTQGTVFGSKMLTGMAILSNRGTIVASQAVTKALTGQVITSRQGRITNLQITTTSLPDAQVGMAYNQSIFATGGVLPYVFQGLIQPNSGGWASTDGPSGRITGTPTVAETETAHMTVQDATTSFVSKDFTFNVISNVTFPQLGGYLEGGSIRGLTASHLAPLQVVILGAYVGWTNNAGQTAGQLATATKALNPNVKFFTYTAISDDTNPPSRMAEGNTAIASVPWWVKLTWPNGAIRPSDFTNYFMTNFTSHSLVFNGQLYNQWRATQDFTKFLQTNAGLDGLYVDNFYPQPPNTGDFLQNGTTQSIASSAQIWRQGFVSYVNNLHAASPVSQRLTLANVAEWNVGTTITEYTSPVPILNGGVMESILGRSYSIESQSWTFMMQFYQHIMLSVAAPKLVIFQQDTSLSNTNAAMRYGICSCLLDNAFYYWNLAVSNNDYGIFDETNFNLGPAIAGPNNPSNGTYSSGGLTVWQTGVWRRDFANGIVLVNPRGNGAKTVTLGGTFWRLRQVLDTDGVNNAAQVTSVTLPDPNTTGLGGSGLILSRTST